MDLKTQTPRERRIQALANAYATARAIARNPHAAAQVLENALIRAGYKIVIAEAKP